MKIINFNRDGVMLDLGEIDETTWAGGMHIVGQFGERGGTAGGDTKIIEIVTFAGNTADGRAFGFQPKTIRKGVEYGKRANFRLFKTAATRDAAVAKYLADARKDCK